MNKYKTVVLMVASIVLAILLEIFFFNGSYLNKELQTRTYTVDDMTIVNWTKNADDTYTSQVDAQFIISDINTFVNNIKIIGEVSNPNLDIVTFYTSDEVEAFSADRMIKALPMYFSNSYIQQINHEVNHLRIDLTDFSGVNVKNIKVIINPIQGEYSIIRVLFLSIALYLFFRIIESLLKQKRIGMVIGVIVLIRIIYNIMYPSYLLSADGYDYISINAINNLIRLQVDEYRTFMYPLIIDIFEQIFKNQYYLEMLTAFQLVCSIISSYYLYKGILLLTDNKKIGYGVILLYSLNSAIMGWDKYILCESLALSSTVFIIYLLIRYLKFHDRKDIFKNMILITISIFLRPTFIVFLILILGLFIYDRVIKKEKIADIGIACSIFSMVLIIGYSSIFNSQYGIFTLSNTLTRQKVVNVLIGRMYESYTDHELVSQLDECYANNRTIDDMLTVVYERFPTAPQRNGFANECIAENKMQYYVNRLIDLITVHINVDFTGYYFNYNTMVEPSRINSFLTTIFVPMFEIINYKLIYYIIAIEVVMILFVLKKYKYFSVMRFGILGFLIAITLSAFIGTCAEYMRTAICVVPFIYLVIAYELGNFVHIIKKGKLQDQL